MDTQPSESNQSHTPSTLPLSHTRELSSKISENLDHLLNAFANDYRGNIVYHHDGGYKISKEDTFGLLKIVHDLVNTSGYATVRSVRAVILDLIYNRQPDFKLIDTHWMCNCAALLRVLKISIGTNVGILKNDMDKEEFIKKMESFLKELDGIQKDIESEKLKGLNAFEGRDHSYYPIFRELGNGIFNYWLAKMYQ